MLIAAKQKYYWPTMEADITKYVASCLGCQMAKASLSKRYASQAIRRISELFAVFSVDLCDMTSMGTQIQAARI